MRRCASVRPTWREVGLQANRAVYRRTLINHGAHGVHVKYCAAPLSISSRYVRTGHTEVLQGLVYDMLCQISPGELYWKRMGDGTQWCVTTTSKQRKCGPVSSGSSDGISHRLSDCSHEEKHAISHDAAGHEWTVLSD